MAKTNFFWGFLILASFPGWSLAQTPTATVTPDCCQQAWVTQGQSAAATLNGVGNLAVLGGILYVPDLSGNQIQKFDLDGQPLGVLTGLNGPYCVAAAPNGFLAVGEIFNSNVKIFDLATQGVSQVLSTAGNDRSLWEDPNGDLYVSVSFNSGPGQVEIFKWNGGSYDAAPLTLAAGMGTLPTGLVKNTSGGVTYLDVADGNAGEVLEYTQAADYNFGSPVTVTDHIPSTPAQMAVGPRGDIYITSSQGYGVYDGRLNFLYSCGSILSATGVATDGLGGVYLVGFWDTGDGLVDEVQKYISCELAPTATPTPAFVGAETCFIYPSPLRGTQATLCYSMTQSGKMELKIWNQNGEWVQTVTDQKGAGIQKTLFSIAGCAPGVYFYQMTLTYPSGQTVKAKMGKFVVIH